MNLKVNMDASINNLLFLEHMNNNSKINDTESNVNEKKNWYCKEPQQSEKER